MGVFFYEMFRPAWKQAVLDERAGPLAPFFEDTRPMELGKIVITRCDDHLKHTSLDYLASRSEAPFTLPSGLLLDDDIDEEEKEMKDLFLSDFVRHNETKRNGLATHNELMLMSLAKVHYVRRSRTRKWAELEPWIRTAPTADVVRLLMEARVRLGEAMSRHGHLVGGVPYETRTEKHKRRQENRMDRLCPTDHSLTEWQEKRRQQQEEDERETAKETAQRQLIKEALKLVKRKREKPADYDDEDAIPEGVPPLNPRAFPPAAPYPDVDELFEEAAFFLTCYWAFHEQELAATFGEHLEVVPSNAEVCHRLTNGAVGGEMGLVWSGNTATMYPIMATQFFAQAWSEQRWLQKHPVRDVAVSQRWLEAFAAFLIERLDTQMQDEHVKEFSSNCYEVVLPIGGRGLIKRCYGAQGGEARRQVYRAHSVSVVAEIDEMFDTEASLKLIGYDDTHPLGDAMAMMFVQTSCDSEAPESFSMVDRCMLATSELIQRGRVLEITKTPVITRLTNEWVVLHPKEGLWLRPSTNTFAAAWMVFLSLLKDEYDFEVGGTTLSYWEQKLSIQV